MTIRDQYKHIAVHTITFYRSDEDGNVLQDKNGNDIQFECKGKLSSHDFEVVCEDIQVDDLDEIENVPLTVCSNSLSGQCCFDDDFLEKEVKADTPSVSRDQLK